MGTFPGATTTEANAQYSIVGAPLDVSGSFRPGSRFGPDRIRKFAQPFDDYDHRTGLQFSDLGVLDTGNLDPWEPVEEYLAFLSNQLQDHSNNDRLPIILGGEHTVTVAGLNALNPDIYVCLDAHLDLYKSYLGNSHSHATVTNHALNIVDEIILIGVRTGSKDEWDRINNDNVTVIAPDELSATDLGLSGKVYLSVDIDAADPGFAPGTGTPEPFGLHPREMRDVVRTIAPNAVGFDVVEVTAHDAGQAASVGAKLLKEFVFSHAHTTRS